MKKILKNPLTSGGSLWYTIAKEGDGFYMKATDIRYGLFGYSKKYPFHYIKNNLRDFKILLKRIVFVLRHGYSPVARWEFDEYFFDLAEDVIKWHRYHRNGTPNVFGLVEKEGDNGETWAKMEQKWDETLDKMLDLLHRRKTADSGSSDLTVVSADFTRKEEITRQFMEMFSKYVGYFWD